MEDLFLFTVRCHHYPDKYCSELRDNDWGIVATTYEQAKEALRIPGKREPFMMVGEPIPVHFITNEVIDQETP